LKPVVLYNADSILMIDASPFGQAMSLLRSVKTIRNGYPGSHIAVAASTGTCELVSMMRLADRTIDLGVIKDSGRGLIASARNFFSLARKTGREEFTLVLDFSGRPETQLLSMVGLRTRAITAKNGFPELFDILLGRGGPARPNVEREHNSILRQLGLSRDNAEPVCSPTPEDSMRFEQLIHRYGSRGGEPIVLIYSGDAGRPDSWAVQKYAEVASRLANNFGARIVAADVPSDSAFTGLVGVMLSATAIRIRAPRAPELVAALARASFTITDDFGFARLAADLGTPAIALSGTLPPKPAENPSIHTLRRTATADEVYSAACEMLQKGRMSSIFQRG